MRSMCSLDKCQRRPGACLRKNYEGLERESEVKKIRADREREAEVKKIRVDREREAGGMRVVWVWNLWKVRE